MLFERFEAKGLAHYSYLIGDGDHAVVIDPQRDCEAYVEAARLEGLAITHILETHRNEDYVVGSVELASRTGATVLHSAHDDLPYAYGGRIAEGEALKIGRLLLEPLHTPGHTLGHVSYLLRDATGAPWVLFSGDALFAGDVGRTDFYGPDKLEEMTGLLYDSLFGKLLPLGDGVLLCPAHGSGSACGTGIAERPWTSLGLERQHNPRLHVADKAEFVRLTARTLEYPPYFRRMEELNLRGAPLLSSVPLPRPLSASDLATRARDAVVLDTRPETAFGAAHVPDAISIWEEGLPGWAGWFLPYDKPILWVGENNEVAPIARLLCRLGYDRLEGFLAGGMTSWHKAGLPTEGYLTLNARQLCERLAGWQELWILDVRNEAEVAQQDVPGTHHIPLSHLPQRMDELPHDRPIYLLCGSGVRSTTAASLLQRAGYADVIVILGGLAGWNAAGCPVRTGI
jgi:hydroxyacylglutathione hydrolase